MNIKPLHDRIVVKRLEQEEVSSGGIIIPGSAQEKPMRGEIRATGPGKMLDNGELSPLSVSAGDKVLFGKYSGTEFKLGDEELVVMREEDVLAILV
jgi:chaperonin GroES